MSIKKSIKKSLKNIIGDRLSDGQFVSDINLDCTRHQKRILVSYLDYATTTREIAAGFAHTNRAEMMQMIRVLIGMDLCIDVCGCIDESAAPQIKSDYYDYILGFGDNYRIARERNPRAYAIIYMTENPYYISYERETERLRYYTERTGRKYHLERTGVYYHEDDESNADAVICLGDVKYFKNEKVRRIWPSAMKNPTFTPDFSRKKTTNFLVYGVDGFVHKGNDILVEIFARHPEWTLYLCGYRGAEKAKELGYTLPANVRAMGGIDTMSEQFNEIVSQCVYLLLPSCSEAPSTSVLTGMRHGLIPIVSRGIGLDDLGEYCIYFDDYHIDAVEQTIAEAAEGALPGCAETDEDEIIAPYNEAKVSQKAADCTTTQTNSDEKEDGMSSKRDSGETEVETAVREFAESENLERRSYAEIAYADIHFTLEEYTRTLDAALRELMNMIQGSKGQKAVALAQKGF